MLTFPGKSIATETQDATKASTSELSPQGDPASCEILAGRETVIEINKGKSGLGISIVGGSDTLLVSIHALSH